MYLGEMRYEPWIALFLELFLAPWKGSSRITAFSAASVSPLHPTSVQMQLSCESRLDNMFSEASRPDVQAELYPQWVEVHRQGYLLVPCSVLLAVSCTL